MLFYLSYEGLKITSFSKESQYNIKINLTFNSNLPYHFATQFNTDL